MTPSDPVKVGFVILNWNSLEVTNSCLECFVRLKLPYDVVVVDNGSQDDSIKILREKFGQIKFILAGQNLGFAGGNNIGIKYLLENKYDYIGLLNNDTLFEDDFVYPLIDYLEKNEGIGAVQPKIYFNHNRQLVWNAGTAYLSWIGHSFTLGEGRKDQAKYGSDLFVPWVSGCCFVSPRKVYEEVGCLDERFFIYHEDVDWSFRISQKGFKMVFLPESKIYHISGYSQKSRVKTPEGYLSPGFHYLNIRNQIFLMRKHASWYAVPSISVAFFVKVSVFILYFLLRLRIQKARMIIKGLIDGLTLEIRGGSSL